MATTKKRRRKKRKNANDPTSTLCSEIAGVRSTLAEDVRGERKKMKKIREGPIIGDQPRPSIRGYGVPVNDQRPGLPTPGPRVDLANRNWTTRPQPTTSPDTGFKLNPENPTAGSLTRNPPFP